MAERTRPIRIEFCVTEQERRLIQSKMAQLGTRNMGAYLRKMAIDYANHYATIRKWLDEDSKSKPGKNYDYTETYEEGECL